MNDLDPKISYRQRLPHIQRPGSIFFVTFRLYGSIPKSKLDVIQKEYEASILGLEEIKNPVEKNIKALGLRKKYFAKLDHLLDTSGDGPMYLKEKAIAEIVRDQLHRFDGDLYDLIAYTIMGNHVHILIDTSIQLSDASKTDYVDLDKIMKRIKGASARYANQILLNEGQFWDRESFDIYMRDNGMVYNVIAYILKNAVKARLVVKPSEFPWVYLKDTYGDMDVFVETPTMDL